MRRAIRKYDYLSGYWGGMTTGLGAGMAAGAGLMYWLDPQGGRRRRARLEQLARHALAEASEGMEVAGRDLSHRIQGIASETLGRFKADTPEDRVLVARVRSKMGRYCSHPGAIEVRAANGHVELHGDVLASEHAGVLESAKSAKGVKELTDRLTVHESAEHIPALQGGEAATGEKSELMQENWSPAIRVIAGGTGAGLIAYALGRGGAMGLGIGAFGAALLARGLTNLAPQRLVGMGAGHRAVDIQKTLHVEAPVETVYSFFQSFENFPRFMSHVKHVHRSADGNWHWTVSGPGGVEFDWDAEVTRMEPNKLLAWKSVGGSVIKNAGLIEFQPDGAGCRLNVRMSYNPPGGAIGHAFAHLFGADPKKELDDDLLRFKSLMETGKATGNEGKTSRDELR